MAPSDPTLGIKQLPCQKVSEADESLPTFVAPATVEVEEPKRSPNYPSSPRPGESCCTSTAINCMWPLYTIPLAA